MFVGSRGCGRRESAFRSTCRPIRRGIETREMVADDFVFGIAFYPLRSGIPARHHPPGIESDQCVIGSGFCKQSELPLAFTQRLRGQFLGGHVAANQIDQSVLYRQRPSEPAPRAVLVAKAVLYADGWNTLGEPSATGHRVSRVVGMPELADMHPL